jgi:hypothetical protein
MEKKCIYSVNLTEFMIIDEFTIDDIPNELSELLKLMEKFRVSSN